MRASFIRKSAIYLTLILAPLLFIESLFAQAPRLYYDEVFDELGNVRPHYQEVWKIYSAMSENERAKFSEESKRMFSGDVAIDPLPRLLLDTEFETLKTGVIQRGTALRKFVEDYYAGGTSWQKVIPADVMSRIISRSSEGDYRGKINPNRISFPYGPDIIRDRDGIWRVLEDNIGNIGGPGDIALGREALLSLVPGYREKMGQIDDPAQFFKILVDRFREQAHPRTGKIVLYTLPTSEEADKEVERIREHFAKFGVECVWIHSKTKRLRVEPDGVYLETKAPDGQKISERVGYLILSADPMHVDSTHPASYRELLRENIKTQIELLELAEVPVDSIEVSMKPTNLAEQALADKLRLVPIQKRIDLKKKLTGALDESEATEVLERALNESPIYNEVSSDMAGLNTGILSAILDGKVASNYTPGVDFIGDKEFNAYVDDLVRFYLNEEPILRSIESRSFAHKNERGETVLDEEWIQKVFSNKDEYVIKVVDGRGGDGIWVGPKTSEKEFIEKAKAAALKEPLRYRAQTFKHPSVMAGKRIVDLRLLSQVDPQGVRVGPTPFGRTISIDADGKVNVSANGYESAVATVPSLGGVKQPRAPMTASAPKSIEEQWQRVAKRMKASHGISLRFAEKLDHSGDLAYYSDKESTIILNQDARVLGPGDSGFLHEMLHAFEHWRFKQGIQSPLHIDFFNMGPQPRRSRNVVDRLYHEYLGADELFAYAYSNYLIARDELWLAKDSNTKSVEEQVESLEIVMDELRAEHDIALAVQQKARSALERLRSAGSTAIRYSVGDVFVGAANLLIATSEHEVVGVPIASVGLQTQIKGVLSGNPISPQEKASLDYQTLYLAKDQLLRLVDLVEKKLPQLEKTYRQAKGLLREAKRGNRLSEQQRKLLLKAIQASRSYDLHFSSSAYEPMKLETRDELELEKAFLVQKLKDIRKQSPGACGLALKAPQTEDPLWLGDDEMRALMKIVFKK